MTIDYFSLGHPLAKVRSHYAVKARQRMLELFMQACQPEPASKVLDLGVTPDESLPESNYFEKHYSYKHQITAASIENAKFLEKTYPGLRFVQIAPGPLPFADNEFDFVFCSAVIEHVGDSASQQAFVNESLRIAKQVFFTTPNRQFPLDFHTILPFLHWLPQRLHQASLRALGLHFWAKTENLNLLSPAKFLALFSQCTSRRLFRYHLLGMPSNLVIVGQK